MSKQRIVRDSFWTDSYIERLTPDEKLVFLYLLTNPLCNVAGVYEIRTKRIGFDTGYDIEVIDTIVSRLVKDGKLRVTGDWIMIANFIKNQSLNPSIEAGITRVLSEMPEAIRNQLGLMGFDMKTLKRSTTNFIEAKNREAECRVCSSTEKLQVDHIQPVFAGGGNDLSNLQVLCHECHKTKTQKDHTAYEKTRRTGCTTLLNSTLPNPTLPNLTDKSEGVDSSESVKVKSVMVNDMSTYNPLGADIIKLFETVDPKNKTYYGNKTQRAACDFLLAEYGFVEIEKRTTVLPKTNGMPFFPNITTPCQLRDKWVQLDNAINRARAEQQTKSDNVIW